MFSFRIAVFCFFLFTITGCTQRAETNTDTEFESQLRQTLQHAKPGDVIELPEGTYTMQQPLVIAGVKHITLKGKGKDKTVIKFKRQEGNAEGFRITADGIVLEDFTISNAGKYGVHITNSFDVTLRKLKVVCDAAQPAHAGWYGLYPSDCSNVLVEECEVSGARLAGIAVNLSKNVIIRRNSVHDNTTGIAVENSSDVDVMENVSKNNTVGVLSGNLPVMGKSGKRCRVLNNKMEDNNRPNTAPPKTVYSLLPSGIGLLALAAHGNEVFNNEINNHPTASIALLSYLTLAEPFVDNAYDPYCGGVYLHENKILRGTGNMDHSTRLGKKFAEVFSSGIPEIIYDGLMSDAYKNYDGSIKTDQKICISNNGDVTIGNLRLAKRGSATGSDKSQYDCTNPTWNEVKLLR